MASFGYLYGVFTYVADCVHDDRAPLNENKTCYIIDGQQ